MIFQHHVPGPPLSDFIEMMWFGEDYIVPFRLERVLPTGDISLIINLYEDRTRVYDPNNPSKFQTLSGAILIGAYSRYNVIDTAEQRSTMGVIFKPGGSVPFFKLPAERILVAHDELDLPYGVIRLKLGGGDNGHNGLRSVTAALGSRDYHRLRIGIGRPAGRMDPADFVLQNFSGPERAELPELLGRSADAVEVLLTQGLAVAQNKFH